MATDRAPFSAETVEDGKRYRIKIKGRTYYVILTQTSVTLSYQYENWEEDINTRTILEKFCAKLSEIMEAEHHARSGQVGRNN